MRLLRRSFTGLCRARFLLLRSRQEIIPVVSHNRPTPKVADCFDSLLMLFINSSLVVLPTVGFQGGSRIKSGMTVKAAFGAQELEPAVSEVFVLGAGRGWVGGGVGGEDCGFLFGAGADVGLFVVDLVVAAAL